jgi:chromosome segregation ATPase
MVAKFNEITNDRSEKKKELLKLTEEFTKKEQEKLELQEKCSSLEAKEENLKAETTKNQETLNLLNQQKIDLEKSYDIFLKEVDQRKEILENYRNDVNHLESQILQMTKENEMSEQMIQSKQIELNNKT